LASAQLGSRYAAKLDPSDLVQQTFLDAQVKLAQFRGTTERERAAWLRQIFTNNLSDVLRDFTRQKRSVAREQSSDGLAACLVEPPDTFQDEVEEEEQLYRLSWALSQLPQPQRLAIELHHLRGLSLAQTAQHLARTQASVAGLIRRGMAQLRDLLISPSA
jgi:RNA polymerase sigma-70 factor (ECF subfamily)